MIYIPMSMTKDDILQDECVNLKRKLGLQVELFLIVSFGIVLSIAQTVYYWFLGFRRSDESISY